MKRLVGLGAAAAAAAAVAVAPAHAAENLRIGIADDRILLAHPERAPEIVARWKELGIEVVRVHARWVAVAPGDSAAVAPRGFAPSDPDDPQYDWAFLDYAVNLLTVAGIEPMLAVTGSGPLWSSRDPKRGNPRYKPDPRKFGAFATAVARRFGDRVDRYVIYNEPNQPGWLQPQFECPRPERCYPMSPHVYRDLVNAAEPGIRRADSGAQIYVGALAPRGGDPTRRNRPMRPLPFIRAFGCLDERYERIRTGPCRNFRPALIDGFSYHPHGVMRSPHEPNPNPDEAAIADLGRLAFVLDEVQAFGGIDTFDGRRIDIHLTEFGYQTKPPDPYSGVSTIQQKLWLQEAAYVSWTHPRVRTLIQYEWEDDPIKNVGLGPRAYAGWQSGLLYADGRPKPALGAFAHPFWADVRPGASKVRFWGQVRAGGGHPIRLQRRVDGAWTTVTSLRTDRRGYFSTRLFVQEASPWRFAYDGPATDASASGPTPRVSASLLVRPPAAAGGVAAGR